MFLAASTSKSTLGDLLPNLQKIHRYTIILWLLPAISVVILSAWLGYIGAIHESDDSVEDDWKACFFAPNNVYNALIAGNISVGTFVNSLIFVGMVVLGMTFLGMAAVHRSWHHPGWLMSAAFFGLWCSLVSFTYYTSAPPLPVPSMTNATLFLFLYWLKEKYFDELNDSDNECNSAYQFVLVYLTACVLMIFLMGIGTSLAFYAEYVRYKSRAKSASDAPQPVGAAAVLFVTILMFLCYLGAFLGKLTSSITSVDCFRNYQASPTDVTQYPDIYFPFSPGYISVASLLWAVVFVAVLRAYVHNRVSPYRLVALASLLYVFQNYASMVYVMQLYYHENLDSDHVCLNYFQNDAVYGYPDQKQSNYYCYSFRITTFLGLILFILMHVQAALSSFVYLKNKDTFERQLARGDKTESDTVNSKLHDHDLY